MTPFAYSIVSLCPLTRFGSPTHGRLERAVLEVPGGRVVDRAADLPAEREDAVVVVQVLADVAGRGVQDVRRAADVLRRDHGLPVRPDLREDPARPTASRTPRRPAAAAAS